MAVDEAARHQLYNDLVDAVGPASTGTIMELLPPVGWADVATKHDLVVLENSLRSDLDAKVGSLRADLHAEIGTLRTEFHTTMRTMLFSMLGAMFTLAGLTWAAMALA